MLAAPVAVTPPAAFAQKAPPSDNLLTVKVENALNAEHVFQGMRVNVTVSKGVVTLSGFVTSDAAKVLASEWLDNLRRRRAGGRAANPASPYMERISDLLRKKITLGTDDWMKWLPPTPSKGRNGSAC